MLEECRETDADAVEVVVDAPDGGGNGGGGFSMETSDEEADLVRVVSSGLADFGRGVANGVTMGGHRWIADANSATSNRQSTMTAGAPFSAIVIEQDITSHG
jgi:hypothetical protein